MNVSPLGKMGGLLLLVAGVLWIVSSLIHPSDFDPAALSSPLWLPNAILLIIAYLLIPCGLLSNYRSLASRADKRLRAGIFLASFGSVTSAVTSFVFGFIAPAVAAEQPNPISLFDLIKPGGQLTWAGLLLSTYVIFFLPGCILIGLSIVRGGISPRSPGFLMVAGITLFSLGRIIAQLFILTSIGGVVFGIAIAWLGFSLTKARERNLASGWG